MLMNTGYAKFWLIAGVTWASNEVQTLLRNCIPGFWSAAHFWGAERHVAAVGLDTQY